MRTRVYDCGVCYWSRQFCAAWHSSPRAIAAPENAFSKATPMRTIDLDDDMLRLDPILAMADLYDRLTNERPIDEPDSPNSPSAWFRRILLRAMESHAECLHTFIHPQESALRLQIYIPVGRSYSQTSWNRLPNTWGISYQQLMEEPMSKRKGKWGRPRPNIRIPLPDRLPYISERWGPPPPTNPGPNRAWIELHPLHTIMAKMWFTWLSEHTTCEPHGSCWLGILYKRQHVRVALVRRTLKDTRLYFGAERPPIRPFTRAQYRELGLKPPARQPGLTPAKSATSSARPSSTS